MSFAFLAPKLRDAGYDPLPVILAQKRPAVAEWTRPASESRLAAWVERYADHGVGILAGLVIGIDIDILSAEDAAAVEAMAITHFGPTPLVRIGAAPKRLMAYRAADRESVRSSSVRLTVGGIDIVGAGRMFVGYGIHPVTREPYRWIAGGEPLDTALDALPLITGQQVEAFLAAVQEAYGVPEKPVQAAKAVEGARVIPAVDGDTGLIADGRDEHLRGLIYDAWRADKQAKPGSIAARAWARFCQTSDTLRPKGGRGTKLWTHDDALHKARQIVRKAARDAKFGSASRLRPHAPVAEVPPAVCEAFAAYSRKLHAEGRINGTALAVSAFMLARLAGGQCVDSAGYIAQGIGKDVRTVKRARADLVSARLWIPGKRLANRNQTSPYKLNHENLGHVTVIPKEKVGVVTLSVTQTIGGSGGDMGALIHHPVILPTQPADTIQGFLFPPLIGREALVSILDEWTSGPMPQAVRIALLEARKRRGMGLGRVARDIGISIGHISNSLRSRERSRKGLPHSFDLSPAVIDRVKIWLLAEDVPALPKPEPQVRRPHHRKGGRRHKIEPTAPLPLSGPRMPLRLIYSRAQADGPRFVVAVRRLVNARVATRKAA